MKSSKPTYLLGITGATGMLFLRTFLELTQREKIIFHAVISDSARKVLQMEEGLLAENLPGVAKWFDCHDLTAPPASGSADYRGMVILPCTMGSLAAVASGLSINLIHRAADVMLKEKRRLILAVRETPFNRTHLQNMLAVHDAGGIICPTMPSFYLKPKTLDEAALSYVWRLLDQLEPGIKIEGRRRWRS